MDKLSYYIALDGVPLASVSPLIRIADVIELRPERTTNLQARLQTPGSLLVRDHIASREVRVQFAVLTSELSLRTRILSDVTAWAMNGRVLEIADRPGQRLQVRCTETPQTMSKRKWTELCEMTFTAHAVPFWEDRFPVTVSANAVTEETLHIRPTGNVQTCPLRCSVTPEGGALTSLTIVANGAEMAFSGLAVPGGKTLAIDYQEGMLVAFWTDTDGSRIPCLSCRTGSEGIPLNARQDNAVRIAANTACKLQLSAKGWYW